MTNWINWKTFCVGVAVVDASIAIMSLAGLLWDGGFIAAHPDQYLTGTAIFITAAFGANTLVALRCLEHELEAGL